MKVEIIDDIVVVKTDDAIFRIRESNTGRISIMKVSKNVSSEELMVTPVVSNVIVVNDKNKEPIVLNHKLKPFDITFTINSIDEAKMLILMFESSPTIFKEVIEGIKKKVRKQGYTL
jgi:hypothetical protein